MTEDEELKTLIDKARNVVVFLASDNRMLFDEYKKQRAQASDIITDLCNRTLMLYGENTVRMGVIMKMGKQIEELQPRRKEAVEATKANNA